MAAKSKIKCFECIKGNGYMIFVEWNFSYKRQKEKHPKNISQGILTVSQGLPYMNCDDLHNMEYQFCNKIFL